MHTSRFILASVLFAGIAMAEDKPLDVTIQVIESPNDLPTAVTKKIQLPPSAADRARERALTGIDMANDARLQPALDPIGDIGGGLPAAIPGGLPGGQPGGLPGGLPGGVPKVDDLKPLVPVLPAR